MQLGRYAYDIFFLAFVYTNQFIVFMCSHHYIRKDIANVEAASTDASHTCSRRYTEYKEPKDNDEGHYVDE